MTSEPSPPAPGISRDRLRALLARRDGPGLARLGVQLLTLVGGAYATVLLARADDPLWLVSVTLCATGLVGFFPAMHETAHRTAFRRGWLNELVVWLGAILMLHPPSYFREFHWAHHRHTQDQARDPEIAGAAAILDGWPRNLAHYALLASGALLLFGKPLFTVTGAVLPARAWARVLPFVRAERRARVAWECRLTFLVLIALFVITPRVVPGFGHVLLAWPIAHVMLALFVMPEHSGLGHDGDQLARTRTIRARAPLRWWMWNMPYHAEHHAHPAVPFHALPELHRQLRPALQHELASYLAFHAEALRRALAR